MQSWHSSRNKPPTSQGAGKPNRSSLASTCLQIVDVCLLGTVFLAPLFFGGRHPLGRFVFILLASAAGVAWAVRQTLVDQGKWTRSWANILGFAATLLLVFQLIPLPTQWLAQLAPRNTSLLTLWNNDTSLPAQLGTWETLSLSPISTKIALATLIAYLSLFITAVGRLQHRTDIEQAIRAIALAAILMSGFGILQYFTSNGLFFWFYEHPYTNTSQAVKGSFTTRNHFAHFIVIGVAPILAWIVLLLHQNQPKQNHKQSKRTTQQFALNIALHAGLAITALAALLSFSRGGAAMLAMASTITIVIYFRRGLLSGTYLYGLLMLGLLIVGMLSLSGYETVAGRLHDFTTASIEQLDQDNSRRKIWNANIAATQAGSLFGAGAGSHREIYPIYLPKSLPKEYTHAESGYLQIATENGFIGIALLTTAILLICCWCWRALRNANSKRELALAGAITASLAVSMIHSVADFVWFIPSCMSLTVLLSACALRLAQITTTHQVAKQPSVAWSKPRWITAATIATCAAAWAIATTFGPATASLHWDKYLLSSAANKEAAIQQLSTAQPESADPASQQARIEAMIFNLRNTLTQDPLSPRAHLRLAGKYLQLFSLRQSTSDNAMSVEQIRDAALASKFGSGKALQQWLLQAFGENSRLLYRAHYHTRQALQLSPLQGEGYLYLASLCFLEGHSPEAMDAYVKQSLQVRPYSGSVLYEAGRQWFLTGQVEQAFDLWQKIYRDTGSHQLKIVQLLAGQIPADTFLSFFKPDWRTLQLIWDRYQITANTTDLDAIISYAEVETKQLQQKPPHLKTAIHWLNLARMQDKLGHHNKALISSQQAYHFAPSNYSVRRNLGQKLLLHQQYKQAEPHLRWCLARQPDNAALKNELIQATKTRLQNVANRTTTSRY